MGRRTGCIAVWGKVFQPKCGDEEGPGQFIHPRSIWLQDRRLLEIHLVCPFYMPWIFVIRRADQSIDKAYWFRARRRDMRAAEGGETDA